MAGGLLNRVVEDALSEITYTKLDVRCYYQATRTLTIKRECDMS